MSSLMIHLQLYMEVICPTEVIVFPDSLAAKYGHMTYN